MTLLTVFLVVSLLDLLLGDKIEEWLSKLSELQKLALSFSGMIYGPDIIDLVGSITEFFDGTQFQVSLNIIVLVLAFLCYLVVQLILLKKHS